MQNTDGSKSLHTLLVKHYNDLLERQSSKQGKDEISFFYVGDVFCIYFETKYPDFQEKSSRRFLGKSSKLWVLGI